MTTEIKELLIECEEYFDDRADADCDQDGFIPNKEMRLLTLVREALRKPSVDWKGIADELVKGMESLDLDRTEAALKRYREAIK